jgi:hypothetical protein
VYAVFDKPVRIINMYVITIYIFLIFHFWIFYISFSDSHTWKSGNKVINHNKVTWKLQTLFDCVRYGQWISSAYLTPLAPAWAVLNSQHLIVLASIITKDQENITILNFSTGQLPYSTWHLLLWSIRSVNKVIPWKRFNHNKITWKLQTRFDWTCTRG